MSSKCALAPLDDPSVSPSGVLSYVVWQAVRCVVSIWVHHLNLPSILTLTVPSGPHPRPVSWS